MSDTPQTPYVAPTGVDAPTSAPMGESSASPLSEVLNDLSAKVDNTYAVYSIPKKPNIELKCVTVFPWDGYARCRKLATDPDSSEVNIVAFAALLLELTNDEIKVNGKVVTEDGHPLTIATPSFKMSVNSPSVVQAVRALFGGDAGDGDLISVGNDLIVRAGFALDGVRAQPMEVSDPTSGS